MIARDLQTVLRNARVTGEIIPNRDGTGALTRLGLHHVRSFLGDNQIMRALQRGYLTQVGITSMFDLPIYALTEQGFDIASTIPTPMREDSPPSSTCRQCGNTAVMNRDGNRAHDGSFWCYYCKICTKG